MTELEAGLEAALFAAGDAVSVSRLAAAFGTSVETLAEAAQTLENQYDFEQRGLMLLHLNDKLQLCSRPVYADVVRRVTETRKPPALSLAALEVLTIVAYRQPVTRAFIEQLRGVDSSGTVSGLVEKGLIEEAGHMDVPGRPLLYRTTEAFLRAFSLSSLQELPALPALEETESLRVAPASLPVFDATAIAPTVSTAPTVPSDPPIFDATTPSAFPTIAPPVVDSTAPPKR